MSPPARAGDSLFGADLVLCKDNRVPPFLPSLIRGAERACVFIAGAGSFDKQVGRNSGEMYVHQRFSGVAS